MKISSATGKPKRSIAVTCLLINQFATPGLGSIAAKRYVAGTIQLTIALIGFGFFLGSFVQLSIKTWRLMADLPPQLDRYPWMGALGWELIAIAWLLAWFTTISVWREFKKKGNPIDTAPAVPPKIDGSPN